MPKFKEGDLVELKHKPGQRSVVINVYEHHDREPSVMVNDRLDGCFIWAESNFKRASTRKAG